MIFSVQREQDAIHIHTPAKTGAPARLLQMESYRDLFSWLLLSDGVKQSFESIWRCLNQEQSSSGGRYTRWQFNFEPPATISGVSMDVLGPLDWDSKEMLVWEIKTLQGLELNCFQPIAFHHPALKLSVSGEGEEPEIQVHLMMTSYWMVRRIRMRIRTANCWTYRWKGYPSVGSGIRGPSTKDREQAVLVRSWKVKSFLATVLFSDCATTLPEERSPGRTTAT